MKKQGIVVLAALPALMWLSATPALAQTAEDAASACREAAELIDQDDLVGALDEAQWCVESLRQLKQQATLKVFPDRVDQYVGGDLDNQSAMGMTILERGYAADGNTVTVSLTTGVAGGGLAALAQLGMGMSGAGKKLRVQKRTVIDMSEGTEAQMMVQLKSGGMLNISSSDLSSDELLTFVKAFPIQALDEVLEE